MDFVGQIGKKEEKEGMSVKLQRKKKTRDFKQRGMNGILVGSVDPMEDDRDRARDREKIGTGSKQGKGWRGRLDLDFVCDKDVRSFTWVD